MYYWNDKQERKAKAIAHDKEMSTKYSQEIKTSIDNTLIYQTNQIGIVCQTKSGKQEFSINKWKDFSEDTKYHVVQKDSVSALLFPQLQGKICVLNFASFKNPGGMFLNGSSAQEESLCHESFLYNVLKEFPNFYNFNKSHLNKGMYLDRALYSPDIIFSRNKQIKLVDVLTCAAPNYSVALKYNNFTKEDNQKALESRINFVKSILEANHVDVAILGAWGCGVFKQDPANVANLWKQNGVPVKTTVFAIPDKPTFNIFKSII